MLRSSFAAICVLVCCASMVDAGVIRSPTAVLLNSGGNFSSSFDIGNTIDQSGLSVGFTSGVTDFDSYVALNPMHTFIAANLEWFTPSAVNAVTIVYDLGAEYSVSRLGLWNEEFSGIQTMQVQTSNDPLFGSFNSVGNFNPTISPANLDYPVEVFGLSSATNARYVRLNLTGPQVPNQGNFTSMGEIAFDTSPVVTNTTVPEPRAFAVWSLLAAIGMVSSRRRRSS